tara:strand:- start:236 stop:466 length:231 start_codon:yes stop_codon:yes gene_type:complete
VAEAEEAPQVETRVEQVDQAVVVLILTEQGVPVLQDRVILAAKVHQVAAVGILPVAVVEPVLQAPMEHSDLMAVMD